MQLHKATVRDWMTPDPVTALEEMPLINALEMMHTRNIRRLPITNADGMLVGIITQSDIQQIIPFTMEEDERVESMFALAGMTVGENMTRNPVTVASNQAIQAAAKQMIATKVSGLPVVESGRVVGIITESDIFRVVVEEWSEAEQ